MSSTTALFDGSPREFRLDPSDLTAFEKALGDSAFVLFQKFTAGLWSIAELRLVLAYAALDEDRRAYLRRCAPLGTNAAPIWLGPSCLPSTDLVDRVLTSEPPAHHAKTALRILQGALFGLSAEEADLTRDAA